MFSRRRKSDRRTAPDPPAELPADDAALMPSLRSRLCDGMDEDVRRADFSYSRRIGPLVEVMCRDLPAHVATLTDGQLAGRDVDLLFAAARRNTEVADSDLTPIDVEGGGALWLLEGDHYFVASQLGTLPARIAERAGTPAVGEGILAVAPRRGSVVGVPLVDESSLRGLGLLFDLLDRFADGTGLGGLYYIHDPDFSSVASGSGFSEEPYIQDVRGPDGPGGKPSVVVDGPFGDAMLRAGIVDPGGPPGAGDR